MLRIPGNGAFGLAFFLAVASFSPLQSAEPDTPSPAPNSARSRVPLLADDAAWSRLPETTDSVHGPLPGWARALVASLPRTTAAMLELDRLYRTSEAFDPRLRAKLRWVAARSNCCDYARRYAEADLLRAGGAKRDVEQLEAGARDLPPRERAVLTFARKMTEQASSVTDAEVQYLIEEFGEPAVVAMVLQLAYANFQDRLLLALGTEIEPVGPLPPLPVQFAAPPAGQKPEPAVRPERPAAADEAAPAKIADTDWLSLSFGQLQDRMEAQRSRTSRVSVPDWEVARQGLDPQVYPPDRPVRIKWSLVVLGHQPQLGSAWIKCLRTFGREANQDRVFEETLFWVITRSLQCFY
ncbi:MAG: hypothetical protein JSS02_08945 [Planctomycetes bacterium]|nr:hypothetical protein [Planctomycetota bacterium]